MWNSNTSSDSHQPSRRVFLASVGSFVCIASGCGWQTYEARLKDTKAFYEYLEKVNLALDPKPFQFEGLSIRVPKRFDQLAPPAPVKEGDPEPPPLEADQDSNRLGYYPNVLLEGVIATWKAKVRVESGDAEETAEAPAYLHLLGNLARWEEKQLNAEIEPLAYHDDLFRYLAEVFNVVADTKDDPWDWKVVSAPSPYVPNKKVEVLPITPDNVKPPVDVNLYRFNVKDVQIAILLITPHNIDPRERLEDKLKYTLETMKVPATPPLKKAGKPAASGF